jgi:hypothetical protein
MRGRWPKRFISIARDECGNRFCLSLERPDRGTIYLCDHEEEAEQDEEPTERNLYRVAGSIEEFWNLMVPIDPDEYMREKGVDPDDVVVVKPADIVERGPVIGETEIDAFEARIGWKLPADYRKFMLASNGGRPGPHVIREDRVGELRIARFFSIGGAASSDLETEYRTMRERWPSWFIHIAVDTWGNRFCMALGEVGYGHIYLWDDTANPADSQDAASPPSDEHVFVAMSFEVLRARMERIEPGANPASTDLDDPQVGDDPEKRTLLAEATVRADHRAVKDLLAHGANVNAADKGGWTALHFAARGQKAEVVGLLLAHGAAASCRAALLVKEV